MKRFPLNIYKLTHIVQVFYSDISKKLLEYEVEYHVLQEEVNTPRPEVKKVKQLEEVNRQLRMQNKGLADQLEVSEGGIMSRK